MNDFAIDVTRRLTALEREVRWYKFSAIAILAATGLFFILSATRTKDIAEEIRAKRFVVVGENNTALLDIGAAGDRMPTLTLYDLNGRPRTQLDLLSDGSPRLYFADANQRIRLRLGAGSEGRNQIEIIDASGEPIWVAPTWKAKK